MILAHVGHAVQSSAFLFFAPTVVLFLVIAVVLNVVGRSDPDDDEVPALASPAPPRDPQ